MKKVVDILGREIFYKHVHIYLDMPNTHETDNIACLQGSKFESLVAGDRIGSFFIYKPLHL